MTAPGSNFPIHILPEGWWFGPITTTAPRRCHLGEHPIAAGEAHWYRTGTGYVCAACEEPQRPHDIRVLCPACLNWHPDTCETCEGAGYVISMEAV